MSKENLGYKIWFQDKPFTSGWTDPDKTLLLQTSKVENKYYTPTIADIRVGYEYEYKTHDGVRHTKAYMDNLPWQQGVINNVTDMVYFERTLLGVMATQDGIECIRVPYLTPEQIRAEGWQEQRDQVSGKSLFRKHSVVGGIERDLTMDYDAFTHSCVISYDASPEFYDIILFQGSCPSINELRTICKLIGI